MLGVMETDTKLEKLANLILNVLSESGASYTDAKRAMEVAQLKMGEIYYPREGSGPDREPDL